MNREHRAAPVQAVDGDGRTFTARAVTYGVVDDYGTRFVKGVFTDSLARRLPVIAWSHDWAEPIGRATGWEERDDGLYITARLSDPEAVPRARQAAVQLADGTLDSVSVGFLRLEDRTGDDGVVDIVRGDLDEVSVVLRGAVPGAEVLSIRSARGAVDLDALVAIAKRKAAGELSDAEAKAAVELLAGDVVEGEPEPTAEAEPEPAGPPAIDAEIDAALASLGRSR